MSLMVSSFLFSAASNSSLRAVIAFLASPALSLATCAASIADCSNPFLNSPRAGKACLISIPATAVKPVAKAVGLSANNSAIDANGPLTALVPTCTTSFKLDTNLSYGLTAIPVIALNFSSPSARTALAKAWRRSNKVSCPTALPTCLA